MNSNIKKLVLEYHLGTLDNEGALRLAKFVCESPENAAEFKAEIRSLSDSLPQSPEAEALLARVRNSISRRKATRIRTFAYGSIAAVAASVLLFVILRPAASSVEQELPVPAENLVALAEPVQTDASETGAAVAPGGKVYAASSSSLKEVILSDGSKVTLYNGSKLELDPYFGLEARTVKLEGEAFFDVAKDPDRPFSIHCGENVFVVKGTSFNIISFPEDKYSIVTLHTGSLSAHVNNDTLMLQPGDELSIDDVEDNIIKRKVDVRSSIRWMEDDVLSFHSQPLKVVASQIGHKYGVRLCVHPSLSGILYDGEISNEPLDVALKLLAITAPQKIQINKLNDTDYYITKI